MVFKSDIQIAQECEKKQITEIAEAAGIDEKYLEQYGKYKAKVDYSLLRDKKDEPDGKLILVTAITPTPAGEGKTTTSVGLADGLRKIGENAIAALREPSLGPCIRHKGRSCRRRTCASSSNGRYKSSFYGGLSCYRRSQ